MEAKISQLENNIKSVDTKLSNVDKNFDEFCQRIYVRLQNLEKTHNSDGCSVLRITNEQEKTQFAKIEANVKSNQLRLDANDRMKFFLITTVLGGFMLAIFNTVLGQ